MYLLRWVWAIALTGAVSACEPAPQMPTLEQTAAEQTATAKATTAQQAVTTAPPQNDCLKDVYVFLDISRTFSAKQGARTPLQDYAGAIQNALGAGFIEASDHVVVYVFCGELDVLASTDPSIAAPTSDYKAVLKTLTVLDGVKFLLPRLPRKAPQVTDFRLVADEVAQRLDSGHPQFFIIASDFMHDAHEFNCSEDPAREAEIAQMERKMSGITPNPLGHRHLVKLYQSVRCPEHVKPVPEDIKQIPTRVMDLLSKPFTAKQIESHGTPNIEAEAIKAGFATPPKPRIIDDDQRTPDHLVVALENVNPFAIVIRKISIMEAEGHIIGKAREPVTVPCGKPYEARVSTELPKDNASLVAGVEYDIGAEKSDPSRYGRVTINSERLIYVPNWFRGALILDVTLTAALRKATMMTIEIGSQRRSFPIEPDTGKMQRLLVPVELSAEDRKLFERKPDVPVTLSVSDSRLVGSNNMDINGLKRDQRWGTLPLSKLKDILLDVALIVTISNGIAGYFKRSHQRGIKAILDVLGVLLLLALRGVRFDLFELTPALVVNVFWVGVATLLPAVVIREMVILVLWPLLERRLISAARAIEIRHAVWWWMFASAIVGGGVALYLTPFPHAPFV